jgi:hypothetical protein
LQALIDGGYGTAENLGDLAMGKTFPRSKVEDLAVANAESRSSLQHRRILGTLHNYRLWVWTAVVPNGPGLFDETAESLCTPAATVENSPGHNEQPGPGRLTSRHVGQPTPRDREDLVGGVIGVVCTPAPHAISQHLTEVPGVQLVETAVVRRCHRLPHSPEGRSPLLNTTSPAVVCI